MFIKANDQRLRWEGVISFEADNETGSVIPWRIPHEDKDLFPDEGLHNAASHASGVHLLINTDSTSIKLKGEPLTEAYAPDIAHPGCQVDLCIDNEIIQTQDFNENNELSFSGLPEGRKTIELWFAHNRKVRFDGLEIPEGASLFPVEDKRRKWITYGSSITHCVRAASPAMTWPAIVARKKNLNLTSLGYGGQCKLDSMIARMIRDMDADFISLKLGINVHSGELNPRTFPAAVIGTIAIIREKHKNTPLVVCSPIFSPPRESEPNEAGNSLENMRVAVKNAVEAFQKRGDKNIYYVDGMKIFGPELAGYLPDELHPDAKGMEFMAENFMTEVFEKHGVKIK